MTQPKRPDRYSFVLLWAYPAQIVIDIALENTPILSSVHRAAIVLMFALAAAWGWSYSTKNPARG
jgi:hypothetical protein